MNNPVTLIANDTTPLTASKVSLEHLNELQNTKEWMGNELTTYTSHAGVTMDDITHSVRFLMGAKMVAKYNNRKVENTYGLLFHHSMTEESIGDSDFSLVYLYHLDNTDAGARTYLPSAGPSVNIITIERNVGEPIPHYVNIRVHKDVYQKFALALKTLGGSWLTDTKQRMSLGMPEKFPLDDPKLMLVRRQYENFMANMDEQLNAAANSLIRGDNSSSLRDVVEQSPPIWTLNLHKRFANTTDWAEMSQIMPELMIRRLFAINKSIADDSMTALREGVRIYELHTDNSGALQGLDGWFEGPEAPFRYPDIVIVTTDNVLYSMTTAGYVKEATVTMKQIMSILSLTREDVHPLRVMAPQMSVTFRNGSYVRDPNAQIARKVVTTDNHKIKWAKLDNKNVVLLSVEEGLFENDAARKAEFTTMTNFDVTVPAGITLLHHGKVLYGPTQQCTTIANEKGTRYTLSCADVAPFLRKFFEGQEYKFYDFGDSSDNVETALLSMIFYKRLSEEEESDETNTTTLVRAELMSENYYYDNNLMALNIISAMLNITAPDLKPLVSKEHEKPFGVDFELVSSIVENYMSKNKLPFKPEVCAKIYSILDTLTNLEAIAYLKYINMGFGVEFLKPEFVQADGMLLCKPSGFSHIGGTPIQTRMKDVSDETQFIKYKSTAHSTTCRQSLGGYPSIMWRNALVNEAQATTTDKVLDPTDHVAVIDYLSYLSTMKTADTRTKTLDPSVKGDGWWPLFTPPFMDIHTLSKPHSPVGRMGTNYKTPEEHEAMFFDRTVMDCVYPNVYTANTVFSDMRNNINSQFLYSQNLFDNEDCPFYKYLHYNPTAVNAIQHCVDSNTRQQNVRMNMARPNEEGVDPKNENNISDLTGQAIPKTCWSDMDQKTGVMARDDIQKASGYRVDAIITNGSTDFYINDSQFIGKWDCMGVSQYSHSPVLSG
ncbi:hypothetical protein RRG08_010276 [Elysia crispata]|uniref:Uncharacterized protein n=1 Tax=Elysia crispata TaxID=231223 RepID=A0AAE1D8V5_9GAST|nr:hypothetical protein RRG08_010276 [Elysia crispata]